MRADRLRLEATQAPRPALRADRMVTVGGLHLHGAHITGEVVVTDAHVEGHFDLRGSQLVPALPDEDDARPALLGDRLCVSGDALRCRPRSSLAPARSSAEPRGWKRCAPAAFRCPFRCTDRRSTRPRQEKPSERLRSWLRRKYLADRPRRRCDPRRLTQVPRDRARKMRPGTSHSYNSRGQSSVSPPRFSGPVSTAPRSRTARSGSPSTRPVTAAATTWLRTVRSACRRGPPPTPGPERRSRTRPAAAAASRQRSIGVRSSARFSGRSATAAPWRDVLSDKDVRLRDLDRGHPQRSGRAVVRAATGQQCPEHSGEQEGTGHAHGVTS